MGNSDDKILVERTLAGDRAAFGMLVRRYQHLVFSLMYKRAHTRAEAEDLAQEAFLRAYRKLHTYSRQRPFLPWLLKVAANVATSHLRKHKNRPVSSLDDPSFAGFAGRLSAKDADVAHQVETKALQASVRRAITGLPEKYRVAVTLRYLAELSYADLARVLSVPVGTAKTLVFRAKAKLATALGAGVLFETPPEHAEGEGEAR